MNIELKKFFKPNEETKIKNKEQREVFAEMFSFIFWGGAILITMSYMFFCMIFPPTTKWSATILAVCVLLYLGTLFGISLNKSWPKYWRKFQNKTDVNSALQDDLLYLYLKNTSHNFSPMIIEQLTAIKCSESKSNQKQLLKKLTNQIDSEVISLNEVSISQRSENSYLKLIGILLQLMQDKAISEEQRALFGNQAAIVNTILDDDRFKSFHGLSKTTLDVKFSAANRSLKKNS